MKIMKKNPSTGTRDVIGGSGISPTIQLTQNGSSIVMTVTTVNGIQSATLAVDNDALVAVATATLES